MFNYVPLPDGPVIEGVLPTGQRWAGVEIDGLVYFHVQGLESRGVFAAASMSRGAMLEWLPARLKTTQEVAQAELMMWSLRLAKEKDNAATP